MQVGERIQVKAYKADGTCYRWWHATVEAAGADEVVLVAPAGHWIHDVSGGWASRYAIQAYYWPGKWYSLLEVYVPGRGLVEIYVNINSPVEIEEAQVRFTDYELDISRELPHGARIVDEDEFEEAVSRYGYSQAFQQACYRVAREALTIADRWEARGMSVGKKPQVIARTGDVENAPENTLPAFEHAIARGVDGVELDVHLTADGQLVVHHFYNLGATDDGHGLVCEHTLAELRALDSGSWFDRRFAGEPKPTLRQVLELCRGRTRLEIDLKDSSAEFLHKVIDEIEEFDLAGSVELTTAHYPLLAYIKERNPELRTGTFFYQSPDGQAPDWMPVRLAQKHVLDWADLLGIYIVHLHPSLITADFVDRVHQAGLLVHGSNLDSEEQIRHGLEMGIDQFSTGCLEMALRVREEWYLAASTS